MYSETLKSNINLIVDTINSCETIDQLENAQRMVNYFCDNNSHNDKIGHAKQFLIGCMAIKSKEIETLLDSKALEMVQYVKVKYDLERNKAINLLIRVTSDIFDENEKLINKHLNQLK